MKLVDTDIFIDFFRGIDKARLFFQENFEEVIFSALTEAELLSGKKCEDNNEKEKVLHFLAQFNKIPADNPLVQIGGDLRRKYDLELTDAIIAASTIITDSTLITRNKKDFEKIKDLKILVPY